MKGTFVARASVIAHLVEKPTQMDGTMLYPGDIIVWDEGGPHGMAYGEFVAQYRASADEGKRMLAKARELFQNDPMVAGPAAPS